MFIAHDQAKNPSRTDASMIEFLTYWTLVMRTLAIVAGILVSIDCVKIWTGTEHPPHNPIANAIAWALIATTAAFGAIGLVLAKQPTISADNVLFGAVAIAYIWTGMSAGLVTRAIIRAVRPKFTIMSVVLFVTAGVVLEVLQKWF
jgi:cytochrome b